MLCNHGTFALIEYGHLLLREPHSFICHPNLQVDGIIRLVEYYLVFLHFRFCHIGFALKGKIIMCRRNVYLTGRLCITPAKVQKNSE